MALESDQEFAETSLATGSGFRLTTAAAHPGRASRRRCPIPRRLPQRRQFNSAKTTPTGIQIVAKGLEIRGDRAARLPRVDLVAQYGLFAKFNHYEDYFRTFQRNNGQLGLSFQLPLLPGPGIGALTAQRNAEVAHLRLEMNNTRNSIIMTTRQAWREIGTAEAAREVARLDLEVARDQVSIDLALMQEGRASLSQVEEARAAEDSKWISFYDAGYVLEKARWKLANQTGDLLAWLK